MDRGSRGFVRRSTWLPTLASQRRRPWWRRPRCRLCPRRYPRSGVGLHQRPQSPWRRHQMGSGALQATTISGGMSGAASTIGGTRRAAAGRRGHRRWRRVNDLLFVCGASLICNFSTQMFLDLEMFLTN